MIKFYFEKVSKTYCENPRVFWILITFTSGLCLFYLTSKLNVTTGNFISLLGIGSIYLQASILGFGSRYGRKQNSTLVLKLQALA